MAWLTDFYVLLEKIPATFWGVVIGAFFSLSGVLLSNGANDRRLRRQLEFDREQKNRERELSLRKDVYLAAAEAISTGFNSLGNFANLDIPFDKLTTTFVEKSPAIAKVHVIAKENTVAAVTKLTTELGAAYLRLLAKRLPLATQKNQIVFLKEQIDSFGRERDRMLELMKQHNLDGESDQRRWAIIEANHLFERNRITESIQEHDRLAGILSAGQLALLKDCIQEATVLSRLLVPALVAIRAELELPINEERGEFCFDR